MQTGIVKDPRYLEHDPGAFHVESPERLKAIYKMIENEIDFPYTAVKPREALEEEIQMIHPGPYVELIKNTSGKSSVALDPDTSTSPRSYEAANLAVGGVLEAEDLICNGVINNGFVFARPPGHHAEASRAMGFCLFNNVAVGSEYLIKNHNCNRVMIIDWDLHHGNGTQNSFYSREDVCYLSTHQFPHYPGTGRREECGAEKGEGFTVNIPLLAGKTDEDYLFIFQNIISPIAGEFKPQFILVSAGFDTANSDPLGGMGVTPSGFGAMAASLLKMAADHAQGRILFVLEGGYDLAALKEGSKQVLLQLAGHQDPPDISPAASLQLEEELKPVFQTQKKYWKTLG